MASTKSVKVPTIDFSNHQELKPNTPLWESTKIQVFEALQEYGCFEAIYDKVPNNVREDMFGISKEIFEFPLETKLKNISEKPIYGYMGMIPQLPLYESLCIPDLLNPQSLETFANIFLPQGHFIEALKELVDEEHPLLFKPYEMLGLFKFGTAQTGYSINPNDVFKAYCGV
ncbi:hypothetical protein RDI58_004652 [Solanum bulbocastanum]|uniref:Non-haem dioxygenase N-terminal domain-containing protein n=1 Tax=Solanum bulbocastanum TaxID=147425 RepID=A0AAN8U4Y5_SOLBU